MLYKNKQTAGSRTVRRTIDGEVIWKVVFGKSVKKSLIALLPMNEMRRNDV